MEEGTHSAQSLLASFAWAHGVLSKLLKHFSPEELDQLVASEELLMQLSKQLNTEGEETSETPETDEGGESFQLARETLLADVGLGAMDLTFFSSLLGLRTIGDLIGEKGSKEKAFSVPDTLQGVWEERIRNNRFAELRQKLLKGGFKLRDLPEWLQPPREEDA